MVADIGASMLARLVGMELDPALDREDEEMLSFWIQALEENNRFILRVASRAQQAIAYLLSY
jgi:antirestriction protein ArdC